MSPLCKRFAGLSNWVWHAIADSRAYYRPGATGFREVSITDFLLLQLYRHGVKYGDCVVFVPSELHTGADFELVVVDGIWATHFRIQAKRIRWQSQTYPDVGYAPPTNPAAFQVDTLCRPLTNYVPMYLFYNWYGRGVARHERGLLWQEGCCLSPALTVRRLLGKPYSKDLKFALVSRFEVPWTRLVCPADNNADLSEFALQQADVLGARDGVDFGDVRRPLTDDYERLWANGGEATVLDGLRFDRPVVMVSKPGSRRGRSEPEAIQTSTQ